MSNRTWIDKIVARKILHPRADTPSWEGARQDAAEKLMELLLSETSKAVTYYNNSRPDGATEITTVPTKAGRRGVIFEAGNASLAIDFVEDGSGAIGGILQVMQQSPGFPPVSSIHRTARMWATVEKGATVVVIGEDEENFRTVDEAVEVLLSGFLQTV